MLDLRSILGEVAFSLPEERVSSKSASYCRSASIAAVQVQATTSRGLDLRASMWSIL